MYKLRLLIELYFLEKRYFKLCEFMKSYKFKNLNKYNKSILYSQVKSMGDYLMCLYERKSLW